MARIVACNDREWARESCHAYYAGMVRWITTLKPDLDPAVREAFVTQALVLATPLVRNHVVLPVTDPTCLLLMRMALFRRRLPDHGCDPLATDADWEGWIESLP